MKNLLVAATALLFIVITASAKAAGVTLRISPPQGEFLVGGTFTATLLLDTKGEFISAVGGTLTYASDILQISNPASGPSVISNWVQTPLVSNFDGTMTFRGNIVPGIKTSDAALVTITFRVVSPGEVLLAIRDAYAAHVEDPDRNLLGEARPAAYRATLPASLGPHIESPTHPDPDVWTRSRHVVFSWKKSDSDELFSYALDQFPLSAPDDVPEGAANSIALPLQDGIWYFHLIAKKKDGTWTEASHFAVRVDAAPPSIPELTVADDDQAEKRALRISFSAQDTLSSIDRYEAKIVPLGGSGRAQGYFAEVVSPLILRDLAPSSYRIAIRAYDRAGNFSDYEKDVVFTVSGWQEPFVIGGISIPRTIPWLVAYGAGIILSAVSTLLLREYLAHHRRRPVRTSTRESYGGGEDMPLPPPPAQ